MNEPLLRTQTIARLVATSSLQQSEVFEVPEGLRLILTVYPRPLCTDEAELLVMPENGPAPKTIEQLRSVSDVLSGGWILDTCLDGAPGLVRRVRVHYARAAAASGNVELVVRVNYTRIPKNSVGDYSIVRRAA